MLKERLCQMDKLFPLSFPRSRSPSARPAIVINDFQICSRTFPAYLYLTALSGVNGMWIGGWWDGNVYEDKTVKLWMHAVSDAAEFYLVPENDTFTSNEGNNLGRARL